MLPNMDQLTKHSVDELNELKASVDKAIRKVETRRKKDAMEAAEKLMKEHGFSLKELFGETPAKPKTKTKAKTERAPKYRHPENPNLTWAGFGRRPAWYVELIESGVKEEDLLI